MEPTTLINLVRHYSPSGQESAAVEYLIGRMDELGFGHAYSDEVGNAIGVMGDGSKQIILLGHIDTVPGEIPVRVSPLPEERQDVHADARRAGKGAGVMVLHGRGSVDAKGPLSAFVDAVAAVGAVEGWQFIVIGAIDEERESIGARHIVDKYQPDFAIIGEPSRWNRVTLGYKGSARAQVSVGCQMQHSAGPSQSAPEAAIEVWKRITTWVDKFNSGRERVFEQVSPTLSGFSSKKEDFEETATLQISTRLPLRLKPQQWYAELKKILIASSPFKVSIEVIGFPIPAYKAGRNSPLIRAFLGGIRAEGSRPGFVVKTGTADLNIVAPVWGCPAVAYGPGDSSLDHRPNEHTSLAEYQQAVGVLINVLQKLVVVDD